MMITPTPHPGETSVSSKVESSRDQSHWKRLKHDDRDDYFRRDHTVAENEMEETPRLNYEESILREGQ